MLTTAIITIIVNRGEVKESKKEERIVKDSRTPPALRNDVHLICCTDKVTESSYILSLLHNPYQIPLHLTLAALCN